MAMRVPTTRQSQPSVIAPQLNAPITINPLTINPLTNRISPRLTRPLSDPRSEPPTVEQVEAVIDAMPERYQALVVLAAGTGMRQGECLGVSVDRVDFLRRSITIDRQLVLVGTGPPAFGPPKTEASARSLPLPDVVGAALATQLERWPHGEHGLVFTNANDQAIRRNRFHDLWRPATKEAGIEGLRFHDLRHFYASLLINHGESVKVVQARLGHASASETLDTYAHLWPDNEERTRAAVDDVLGRTRARDAESG
jgi:integrase